MDVLTLLADAHRARLALTVVGDRLSVSGPNTPEASAIVAQLAARKPDVIAALAADPIAGQDITDFVGVTVDLPTLAAIQRRLELLGWCADVQELEEQQSKVKRLYTYDAPAVAGLQRIGAGVPL